MPCIITACPAASLNAVITSASAVCNCINSGPTDGTCLSGNGSGRNSGGSNSSGPAGSPAQVTAIPGIEAAVKGATSSDPTPTASSDGPGLGAWSGLESGSGDMGSHGEVGGARAASTPTTVTTGGSMVSPGPAGYSGAASNAGSAPDIFVIGIIVISQFLI